MSEYVGPRPQPPVLLKNYFKLDCKDDRWRFTVSEIERMEASRLAELFAPESYLQKKRDQNAARKESDKLFLKKFHVAQLRHYGIDFRENWPKEQVQSLLRDAVLGGKVSTGSIIPLTQPVCDLRSCADTQQLVPNRPRVNPELATGNANRVRSTVSEL